MAKSTALEFPGAPAPETGGPPDQVEGIAAAQLRSYIERIERLNQEKAEISANITLVLAEAKANGFDTGTIREVIRLRALDTSKRQERDVMLDLYLRVLGMRADG